MLSAADYDDEYNDYVFQMAINMNMPLNSIRTIEVQNRLASYDKYVLDTIRNAEGIFFEGTFVDPGSLFLYVLII